VALVVVMVEMEVSLELEQMELQIKDLRVETLSEVPTQTKFQAVAVELEALGRMTVVAILETEV
jgi:hypothetical protein